MKRLRMIVQLLVILLMQIGTGLTVVSQNITDYQILQIRLLENQAKTDSLKVILQQKAISTLKNDIQQQKQLLNNCKETNKELNKKINLQVNFQNNNSKEIILKAENKKYKRQLRNRNLAIGLSAILNILFIYKSLN